MNVSDPRQTSINLKDPLVASVLAWLVPGLGHLYQGRTAKGILFFVCLMGLFVWGCYLGGSSDLGWARVVYIAWQGEDKRLPFLCQVGMGLPTLPAWVQANRLRHGGPPLFSGFMAPPGSGPGNHTLDDLNRQLSGYFELGTVYTMIAGLLNILAIYDAWGGPVFPEETDNEDDEKGEADDKKRADEPAAGPRDKT
ncbi:MAG: DUF6677 family protein [Thermoguttaceae bacterium]